MTNTPSKPPVAIIVLGSMALAALFIGLFVWYAQTVIPHTYPTHYTNFWWGLVHGIFILPTFVWSLFAHTVTIYQSPNVGNWYNFGYVIGLSIIFGSSHGARKSTKK
jgi:hypothetical protein